MIRKFYSTKKQVKCYFDFWIAHNANFCEHTRIIKGIDGQGKPYWKCQYTYNREPIRMEVANGKVYSYREWYTLCENGKGLFSEITF